MHPPRSTLILMLKEPQPGLVKTRLGRDTGMVTAAWWFRHQTRRLICETADPRWRTVISLSPDSAVPGSRFYPAGIERWPQGGGDLGTRMKCALARAMPGPALLIGGDIPGVNRRHVAHAFRLLRSTDVVLGPATDGGFWAVGIKGPQIPPALFADVRWSTEHALADTVNGLRGCKIALASEMTDADTIADLAPRDIRATPLRIR